MIRNLKALGLALVAVFAMSFVAASAASAAEFHSESTHTILDASSEGAQVFEAAGNKVECTTVSIGEGTISGSTASEVTVTPEYSNCEAMVGGSKLPARVTFTGCDYQFTNVTNAAGTHYIVHVKCPETVPGSGVRDEIHIEVFAIGKFRPCYTIPQQTPTSGGVIYTGANFPHLTIHATVGGIEYTKETGACGPAGTFNDATYNGVVTVTGTDTAGKEVGVSFS